MAKKTIIGTRLVKKIKFTATIELLSGLHIGGTNTSMAIGGVDNFVVRNPVDMKPYIPGSSLKGKMRSLLELAYGEHNNGGVSDSTATRSGALFGVGAASKDENAHPSRLIVRDAMWIDTDVNFDKTDLYLAESKTEVNIDRITSRANPRTQERVPRGAQFRFEAVLNIFEYKYEQKNDDGSVTHGVEVEDEEQYREDIQKAIELLENDYLGGHGSRGYGHVCFSNLKDETVYEVLKPNADGKEL